MSGCAAYVNKRLWELRDEGYGFSKKCHADSGNFPFGETLEYSHDSPASSPCLFCDSPRGVCICLPSHLGIARKGVEQPEDSDNTHYSGIQPIEPGPFDPLGGLSQAQYLSWNQEWETLPNNQILQGNLDRGSILLLQSQILKMEDSHLLNRSQDSQSGSMTSLQEPQSEHNTEPGDLSQAKLKKKRFLTDFNPAVNMFNSQRLNTPSLSQVQQLIRVSNPDRLSSEQCHGPEISRVEDKHQTTSIQTSQPCLTVKATGMDGDSTKTSPIGMQDLSPIRSSAKSPSILSTNRMLNQLQLPFQKETITSPPFRSLEILEETTQTFHPDASYRIILQYLSQYLSPSHG